jgi:sporulation protein YlmC with PRC-barrel domain
MSEYPYEDKIHSANRVDYKTVFTSDGIKIGTVEVAFAESFIVKLEKENTEIKYQIPRLEIASITDDRIILKLKQSKIDQKYQTSSIEKSL